MKFTLSWLKEHLETDASLADITAALTMIGLEVEAVEDRDALLTPFRIARILTAVPHPNADRLRLLTVDTGSGAPVQVVCGAPNAEAGLVGVFAAPGTFIPGTGITLSIGTIRGVESHGMMCSEKELLLSDAHDGIISLPQDAPVGMSFVAWRGGSDPVIDIAVTPNRPDCLGVRGIARDLAARGLGVLKEQPIRAIPGTFPMPMPIRLDFPEAEKSACPVFAGRVVRGVRNGASPPWLRERLEAIGLRPISTLVDITNYLSYDRARPLHVYDCAKLTGAVSARLGRVGEAFLGLDSRMHEIDAEMCVIADDAGVLGLGGIMGGAASGVTEATTDVLIESAYFDPHRTARTGRRANIISDARHRFERGVDPGFVVEGLELATRMVLDLCGGEASSVLVAGAPPLVDRFIEFPLQEVERLSGLQLEDEQIAAILKRLGFTVAGEGKTRRISVPSFRPDVTSKADLVEEVVRISGLEAVPATPLQRLSPVAQKTLSALQNRTRRAKRILAARGLTEAVTWSFVSKETAALFGGGDPSLVLANPIAPELGVMRPSLIPGLALAVKRNVDRGYSGLAFFEVGQIFANATPEGQTTAAAFLRQGETSRQWRDAQRPVDFFDIKQDVFVLLEALGLDPGKVQLVRQAPAFFHPGRSARLQLGPQTVLGVFGELHPRIVEALDLPQPLIAAEITLERIPMPKPRPTRAKPALVLSGFMPVRRDFAFIVEEGLEAARLIKAAEGAVPRLISHVSLFDVYRGAHVGEGKKSLGIEVTFAPAEHTLTERDIEAASNAIIAAVAKATGGILRG